jgi:hypothetical protein
VPESRPVRRVGALVEPVGVRLMYQITGCYPVHGSGTANPCTAMRYVEPGPVALAEITELLDTAPRRT